MVLNVNLYEASGHTVGAADDVFDEGAGGREAGVEVEATHVVDEFHGVHVGLNGHVCISLGYRVMGLR
jgi:hypothetical protein